MQPLEMGIANTTDGDGDTRVFLFFSLFILFFSPHAYYSLSFLFNSFLLFSF